MCVCVFASAWGVHAGQLFEPFRRQRWMPSYIGMKDGGKREISHLCTGFFLLFTVVVRDQVDYAVPYCSTTAETLGNADSMLVCCVTYWPKHLKTVVIVAIQNASLPQKPDRKRGG